METQISKIAELKDNISQAVLFGIVGQPSFELQKSGEKDI